MMQNLLTPEGSKWLDTFMKSTAFDALKTALLFFVGLGVHRLRRSINTFRPELIEDVAHKTVPLVASELKLHIDESVRPGIVNDVTAHVDSTIRIHEESVKIKLQAAMSLHEEDDNRRFAEAERRSEEARIEARVRHEDTNRRIDHVIAIVENLGPFRTSRSNGDD